MSLSLRLTTALRLLLITNSLWLLVASTSPALAQAVGTADMDEAIALKFYPGGLDEQWVLTHAPGKPVTRLVATLRVDFDKSGTANYLAAAYSNGTAGTLKILKGSNVDDATTVTEIDDANFGGDGTPVLEAVDINNDGIPELSVEFAHSTFLYKFANGNLSLYGPTQETKLGVTSDLGMVTYLDVDGDGVLEILEPVDDGLEIISVADTTCAPGAACFSPSVMNLHASATSTTARRVAVYADVFVREKGGPVTVATRPFAAQAGGGYILRMVNGDQSRKRTVAAAEVRLNGKTILAPNDFNKAPRVLSVPVTLAEENTLTVELRSDPGSFITVTITRQ